MRVVLQRVTRAAVTVSDEVVGSIGKGLCVLVGIHRDDTEEDMKYIIRKILNLRIFPASEQKPWDKSVMDLDLEVLSVSQFTLYGQFKGNKLDFHTAMAPTEASKFYETFLESMKKAYKPEKIQDGKFAAMMSVDLVNDGPVTITFDSKEK
ncbi:CRE-PQN-68 protein [Caenorhabditis remanei]|uniref:D-aminoacyl-tRNA deacylase n=1 Tax=Caenorhabditis remanei TaxID=31234 RepID=E3LTY6_CAERE|nr:CRE-PQN-68 protein [Caenorhabditis remanei]